MLDARWQSCYDAYVRSLASRGCSEHTITSYQSTLKHFFALYPSPAQVSRAQVEYFISSPLIAHRVGQPPNPYTRNSRLTAISSFYSFAVDYTIIGPYGSPMRLFVGEKPTRGIKYAKTARVHRAFSLEEIAKILSVIPDDVRGLRDRAIFLTLLYTARRREEIISLTWGDIEHGTVIDKDGSRREAVLYHFKGKGHKAVDDVAELPAPAYQAIMTYVHATGRQMEPDMPLFIAHVPHEWPPSDPWHSISGLSIWRRMKVHAKNAGLDPARFTVHGLRHLSVKERYLLGQDILSLRDLLRHHNVSVTDTYLRGLVVTGDEGARLLEERFGDIL